MSSEDLAKAVAKLEVDGVSDMAFIIGGAFGVSEALRQSVNFKLSLALWPLLTNGAITIGGTNLSSVKN